MYCALLLIIYFEHRVVMQADENVVTCILSLFRSLLTQRTTLEPKGEAV